MACRHSLKRCRGEEEWWGIARVVIREEEGRAIVMGAMVAKPGEKWQGMGWLGRV